MKGISFLRNLRSRGINYSLDKIKFVLRELGNPQFSFKSIHIAGTNGKGSVALLLSNILKNAHYSVGTYLSPHLIDETERIKLNGEDIRKEILQEYVENYKLYLKELTYFEALTVLAFIIFRDVGVDYAVVETGLGGRLDATNVLEPEIVIITTVSKDHMNYLGNTIKQIAWEKGGIIKKGVRVLLGEMPLVALKELERMCCDVDAQRWCINKDFFVEYEYESLVDWEVVVTTISSERYVLKPGLVGPWQANNIALAVQAAEILGIKRQNICEGVVSLTNYRGRFEILKRNPLVVFDGAHNFSAIKSLLQHWFRYIEQRDTIFVIGFMRDKEISRIKKIINKYNVESYFLKLKMDRSWTPEDYGYNSVDVNRLTAIFSGQKSILIFGSLYMYAEIKDCINYKS